MGFRLTASEKLTREPRVIEVSTLPWRHLYADVSTSLRKQDNNLIHAETAQLAVEQIANSALGLAKRKGRLHLRPLLIVKVLS